MHTASRDNTVRATRARGLRFAVPAVNQRSNPTIKLVVAVHSCPPTLSRLAPDDRLAPVEVTMRVATPAALSLTLSAAGETAQLTLESDGIHDRLTMPLNPKVEVKLMAVFAELPLGTTNWDIAGARVKSGVIPPCTAVRVIGALTDS